MTAPEESTPRLTWAAFAVISSLFLATALVRYLSVHGFSNDHYQYLANAQQMLMGELPTRDFVDPGQPFMYAASAGMQLLLGRTLFAEAVLIALTFGLAAACVAVVGWRVSHSLWIGALASIVSVLAFPRAYGYPKVLLYAVGPLLMLRWVRAPTLATLAAPAVLVAIAFLFRHDHGLYLGAAAAAAILMTPPFDLRIRRRRLAVFGAVALLVLVPYLAFLQANGGLLEYALTAVRFSRRESDRTQLHWSMVEGGSQMWLYVGVHAVALAGLACAWLAYRRGERDAPVAAALAVSAVLVNWSFLRDPLAARLPDVIVPVVLVAAWLTGRVRRLQPASLRYAAMAVVLVMWVGGVVTVSAVGQAGEQFDRTNLRLGVGAVPQLLRERTSELTERYSRQQLPDGRLIPLLPFLDYVDRCTTGRHRLLVAGNAPEIFVYAQRPFAAGQGSFVEGYYQTDAERRRPFERAQQQVIALTIVLSDQYDEWRRSFPELDAFVQSRFRPLTDIPVDAERTIRVLVHSGIPPTTTDRATGWPCYTHNGV